MDDGTGVINCLCWKKDLLKEQGKPSKCECVWFSQDYTIFCDIFNIVFCVKLILSGKHLNTIS